MSEAVLQAARRGAGVGWRAALPYAAVLAAALALPLLEEDYWTVIATRAAIYWVLVSGLNLVVGFAGQLAIGYVALLTLGAYTASVLVDKAGVSPWAGLLAASFVGAGAGVLIGLPALRLRTFYFAMTTLGFATIVTQVALAWTSVTGGGVGVPGPALPAPFDTASGLYGLCVAIAALSTWMTLNVAHSRFGRALVAVRDAEVAAEASGVSKPGLLLMVFLLSGALAGVAGALFATLQSYITPDAFTFDLSVLFFIAILIGGRGSVLGPLLATLLLTALPEFAAPLVAWSTFLYAALLLTIVLLLPGGIAGLLDFANRRPLATGRAVIPRPELMPALLRAGPSPQELTLSGISLSFGAVKAIDGLDLALRPGEVHGLIGPNGSGKTTTLNAICGFAAPQSGAVAVGETTLRPAAPHTRAAAGVGRTFQTPRLVGEASVLDNVMLGGTISGRATLGETLLSLPRHHGDERDCRALMPAPAFLLLDEPAAGLSPDEIARLGELVTAIARQGTGVLLVEHHADLIFAICSRVTVLNLGRVLASGTPSEVRAHREVVDAYLGR